MGFWRKRENDIACWRTPGQCVTAFLQAKQFGESFLGQTNGTRSRVRLAQAAGPTLKDGGGGRERQKWGSGGFGIWVPRVQERLRSPNIKGRGGSGKV